MSRITRRAVLLTTMSAVLIPPSLLAAEPLTTATIDRLSPFLGVWDVERRRPRGSGGPGQANGRGNGEGPPPFGRPDRPVDDERADDPVPGMDRGDRHVLAIMTEAGKKAFAALDPKDLPANNCISPGLPHIVGVPEPQEWMIRDGNLVIHHSYYDTWRTIHLDAREAPAGTPHTHEGYATGRFDGDVFVIRTTHLAATGGGLARNAPASDARVVEERYRLAADGNSLVANLTITDSKYLTQPTHPRAHLTRAPQGTTVESFPCSVEGAQSYLPK